jgi:hypothetical protein
MNKQANALLQTLDLTHYAITTIFVHSSMLMLIYCGPETNYC